VRVSETDNCYNYEAALRVLQMAFLRFKNKKFPGDGPPGGRTPWGTDPLGASRIRCSQN
jgi:hypothetical protein